MKAWMLAMSFVAVLGFSGLADAGGKGGKKGGIKGKIENVGQGTFTIKVHAKGKKNGAATTAPAAGDSLTIQYTASTTITVNGAAAKTVDGTMVGKRVTIVGAKNGNTVTATSITITDGHHKKKAA